uniref:Uncharacterized protein n=1 Tax=Glossina brevipalpis TaxID=37001 RepID=A0A1A9X459_9MUSC
MHTKMDNVSKINTRESLVNNLKFIKTLGNKSPVAARRSLKNTPSPVLNRKKTIITTTTTTGTRTRTRLHSEGDKNSEGGRHSPASNGGISVPLSTFERTQKYRSFRTISKTRAANTVTIANNNNIRPPWNSAASSGAKSNYAIGNMVSNTNNTLLANRTIRSSIRRRSDTVQWQSLWERSLQMRSYGSTGNSSLHKNYDETIKKKHSLGSPKTGLIKDAIPTYCKTIDFLYLRSLIAVDRKLFLLEVSKRESSISFATKIVSIVSLISWVTLKSVYSFIYKD